MPEDIDLGNPNVFYIFQGKYELVLEPKCTMDNSSVMLTKMCTVEFMGDATLTEYSGGTFATLPDDCCPSSDIAIPVIANDMHTVLYITSDGKLSIAGTENSYIVHLNGICFNNCDRWY